MKLSELPLFKGKPQSEIYKTIAAIVLGVLAVIALTWGIILPMFAGKKTSRRTPDATSPTATDVATKTSPGQTPAPPVKPLPPQNEIDLLYQTLPVVFNIGGYSASPPGRNIFAFYEPPKPTPFSPTPTPSPPPPSPPTPTPTPPYALYSVNPRSVYAGSKGFPLRVSGDRFTEDSVILFNGSQLPTTFISAQGLTAQITDNMIASPGSRQISVVSMDGKYSELRTLNVQAPPKPKVQYIGMISRKRNNNDTAYFQEEGRDKKPISARLNDIVDSRFRVKSISAKEVILEDTSLGFQHRLALYRPKPGERNSSFRRGRGNLRPYNPNNRRRNNSTRRPAGIPANVKIYRPTPRPEATKKKN